MAQSRKDRHVAAEEPGEGGVGGAAGEEDEGASLLDGARPSGLPRSAREASNLHSSRLARSWMNLRAATGRRCA